MVRERESLFHHEKNGESAIKTEYLQQAELGETERN